MRPSRLIAVLGTHTEVGKTWVADALLRRWRAGGLCVAARKPVQSYEPGMGPTDAEQLAAATGEHCFAVCPLHRWYPRPMAPPMAADALSRPRIELKEIAGEIAWRDRVDRAVVETIGGVRSPLAHDGDSVHLARYLHVDGVLLVADAGLGTLNAIRLALQCLDGLATRVLLNRFNPADPLHRANVEWLAEHDGIAAFTTIDALAQSYDEWP